MDVKEEDKSEESKKNHMIYYRSLIKAINEIKKEKGMETEDAIREHLDKRIEAMEKDKDRIKKLFPNVTEEEWNGNTE